jgi:hypothetical protein
MTAANTRYVAPDDASSVSVLVPHLRVPLLAPAQVRICGRCGATYDPTQDQQDRAILLAGCCPRCDGQLTPIKATPLAVTQSTFARSSGG